MNFKQFLIIICIGILSGCSWVPFLHKKEVPAIVIAPEIQKTRVVNSQRLREGGNVLMIPFRAGVGVEANEELDKIALSIIQGMADVFVEHQAPLKVLTAEDAYMADFVMEGYITTVGYKSKVRQWTLRENPIEISGDGIMMDQKTGADVFVFDENQKSTHKKETHKDLGYQLGRRLGDAILRGIR